MKKICFYFQVHQPCRINEYSFFDLGNHSNYWNEELDRRILDKVSDNCYLPANKQLLSLIENYEGKFKVTFSLSGTVIEQFEKYRPDVLVSFQELVQTGCVEILGETYYHSLSSLYDKEEFEEQVMIHQVKIKEVFDIQPITFRNTELIYTNEIAQKIKDLGFEAIFADAVQWNLQKRTPNQLFKARDEQLHVLVRNVNLSDDIAFRFGDSSWKEAPLTSKKYIEWINLEKGNQINLFMDYETFGEHQKKEVGIFEFLSSFVHTALQDNILGFVTPSQVITDAYSEEEYHVPLPISWADQTKDTSTWAGNAMQREAITKIYELKRQVKYRKDVWDDWRKLQTSDLFYYMSTKTGQDGNIHDYFRPYQSAYDAYIFYMNIISDLRNRI